jgi:GNAT superfamily N-acetyltransferase
MSQEFANSQITTFEENGLVVVKVDQRDFTFEHSLEATELFLEVYENDSGIHYFTGPKFRYGQAGVKLINETVDSAVERADKLVEMGHWYRKLLYSFSRLFHLAFTSPQCAIYFAYLKRDGHSQNEISETQPLIAVPHHSQRQLVGVAGLTYPKYTPPVPQTVWQKLYRFWLIAKYLTIDFFTFLGMEHPIRNKRMGGHSKAMKEAFDQLNPKTIDQLAAMSPSEIADAVYATEAVPWLQPMYIAPSFQGKGIGTRLLGTVFGQFQEGSQVTFESSDGKHKSTGPLKIVLDSSMEGLGLYKKLGFKPLSVYNPDLENTDIEYYVTRLMRVW